jgi:hypothetical protein
MKINLWAVENIVSIIIEDEKSPVVYSNQTNGYACSHPEIKGYLIPVEFNENISQKFFCHKYAGNGWKLDKSFYDDVPEIIKQLFYYFCEYYTFELNESKIDKNAESWVFLIGKRNKPDSYSGILEGFPDVFTAVLTWPNSD